MRKGAGPVGSVAPLSPKETKRPQVFDPLLGVIQKTRHRAFRPHRPYLPAGKTNRVQIHDVGWLPPQSIRADFRPARTNRHVPPGDNPPAEQPRVSRFRHHRQTPPRSAKPELVPRSLLPPPPDASRGTLTKKFPPKFFRSPPGSPKPSTFSRGPPNEKHGHERRPRSRNTARAR